jgi:hypothetical protein
MRAIVKSKAEAKVLVEDTRGLLHKTFDIQGRLRRSPYATVAGAVGMGFVLGGGLFTRLTAKIFGAGLRIGLMAALPTLQKEMAQAMKSKPNKETAQ